MANAGTRLIAVAEHRGEDGTGTAPSFRGRAVMRCLFHDLSPVTGLALLLLIVALRLLAPMIARYDPDTYHDYMAINQLPSGNHWFGTDYLGRNLWSQVLYGGRISLPLGPGW